MVKAAHDALAALDALGHRRRSSEALRDALVDGLGLKPRNAFGPVRVAITGRRVSPPLFESLELLGRERSLARLAQRPAGLSAVRRAGDDRARPVALRRAAAATAPCRAVHRRPPVARRSAFPHAEPTPYHLMLRTWTYAWWRPVVGMRCSRWSAFFIGAALVLRRRRRSAVARRGRRRSRRPSGRPPTSPSGRPAGAALPQPRARAR